MWLSSTSFVIVSAFAALVTPIIQATGDDHGQTDENDKMGTGNGTEHGDSDEHDPHWGYTGIDGPSNWSLMYEECSSKTHLHQSPINIDPLKTRLNELLMEISLISYPTNSSLVAIVNNGHTVGVVYNRSTIRLADGGYDHTYRAVQLHFHWGNDSLTGSEHKIAGKQFPLEMHVVTYDEDDFSDMYEAAAADGDGIAVLGVLFEISEEDNDNFTPIVSHLKDVRKPGASVIVAPIVLRNLLPSNLKDYYRYKGSLTTPPCFESVVWTVFATTVAISEAQLSEFRSLYEGDPDAKSSVDAPMLFNWRPIQPLDERTVYRSFPSFDSTLIKKTSHDSDYDVLVRDSEEENSPNKATGMIGTVQHNVYVFLFLFLFVSAFANLVGLL